MIIHIPLNGTWEKILSCAVADLQNGHLVELYWFSVKLQDRWCCWTPGRDVHIFLFPSYPSEASIWRLWSLSQISRIGLQPVKGLLFRPTCKLTSEPDKWAWLFMTPQQQQLEDPTPAHRPHEGVRRSMGSVGCSGPQSGTRLALKTIFPP